jgi:acetylornithine/N-succinyldiaminopimelate aminotransferase
MDSFKSADKEYVSSTYARFDVELTHGKGSLVYDINGKEYIDLNSGIAVNTFGISDDIWKSAVISQLDKIQHTSNLYYSEPCAHLAEMLCNKTGAKKVFFSNSGAEANECAIKAARLWGEKTKGKECCNIITLKNSFHGRTITTLSATGQDVFHKNFQPLTSGFFNASPNFIEEIEVLIAEYRICGIMMELVQGEGGVMPLDNEFVQEVYRICKKKNILLIIDEVQTGNGRSGHLYAYEHYGILPDIVTTAKGLAGGLPLGATLFFDKTADVFTPGTHGSTFGGNPISCSAALSVLERIDDNLLSEVRAKSQYIFDALSGADGIVSVSGLGLMIGVETKKDVNEIISKCIERGVLPIKAKNKLRLLPALNIPWDLLKKAVEIIKEVAKENV